MNRLCFACVFLILASTMTLAKSNPVPLIYQPLVPTSATPGSSGFTLTISGTGFASGSVVNWNGSPRATTVLSGSTVQATINAADVAKAGTASVTVINPGKPDKPPTSFSSVFDIRAPRWLFRLTLTFLNLVLLWWVISTTMASSTLPSETARA